MNITVVVWTTVMFVLFPACSGDNKNLAEAITERDSLPTMKTLGVTTLISDSGITRYKIITEEWEIYDKKNPPYWAFEKESIWRNSILCFTSMPASKPIQLIITRKRNFGN